MANTAKARITVAIAGIAVVLAVGGLLARRALRAEVRTVTGTITRVDPQTRTASIELVHPKTGRTIQIGGTVPPRCDIRIDGQPADLSSLKVGDLAEVQGTIHWDTRISVNWVHVRRA